MYGVWFLFVSLLLLVCRVRRGGGVKEKWGMLPYRMSCFIHFFDEDAFLLLTFWTSFLSRYPTFGFHMSGLLLPPRLVLAEAASLCFWYPDGMVMCVG